MQRAPLSLLVLAALLLAAGVSRDRARADEGGEAGPEVQIDVRTPGTGEPPAEGDRVTIDYVLRLPDGTEVGSTFARKRPVTIPLEPGRAIPGMLQALRRLRPGAVAVATIPAALAYGSAGKPSRKPGGGFVIPPDTDLVYEITVREVLRRPRFPTVDPKDARTTRSGLRYWVLAPGSGAAPRPEQRVRMAYVLWNEQRALVFSTGDRRHWIDGRADRLQLMVRDRATARRLGRLRPEPLLREAAALMKPGMRCLFEAPADLTWGNETPDPRLRPGGKTWWDLTVVSVSDIPAFPGAAPAGLETSKSGLRYRILRPGTGRAVTARSRVETHYQGWLEGGKRFDSSFERGHTQTFVVGGVVAGFREGLLHLREGGRAILVIPPSLGYGSRGAPGAVPPGATLIFDVEVLRVR